MDYRTPNIYDPSTLTEPYAYARGNPTMFWDPNGLNPTTPGDDDLGDGKDKDRGFIFGMVKGYGKIALNIPVGIFHLVTAPVETGYNVYSAVKSMGEITADFIFEGYYGEGIASAYNNVLLSMNREETGKFIADTTGNAILILAPYAKGGAVAEVSQAAGKMGEASGAIPPPAPTVLTTAAASRIQQNLAASRAARPSPGFKIYTQAERAALNTPNKATLRPYGGPGGGHHVPAKIAFTGAAKYDGNSALAIPNAELARLGVKHPVVTASQMRGYRAFAKTGESLNWESLAQIETEALVAGGMERGLASATVRQAIEALKQTGVPGPTRIPWGGK